MTMKLPYFPGCTLHEKARNFDQTARAAAQALGFELAELEGWTCCGAAFPLAGDNLMGLVPAVRILAQASQQGEELVTLCSFCYNVLKRANKVVREDTEKRDKINMYLDEEFDEPYTGQVEVLHFLEVLRDKITFEELAQRVKRKLPELKLGPYYGCLLLRPPKEIGLDDPDHPQILHNFLSSLGCQVIDFPFASECCGSYQAVRAPELAMECSYRIIKSARLNGIDALVTSCPLCHFNLDAKQKAMAKKYGEFSPLPIFYFTQLLAVALDLEESIWGFDQHQVRPDELIKIPVVEEKQ